MEKTAKAYRLGIHSVEVADRYGAGIPGVPVEERYRPDGPWLTTDVTRVAYLVGNTPTEPVQLVVTTVWESFGPSPVDTTYLLIEV